MKYILIAMTVALALPLLDTLRQEGIWEKLLAFASVSTKASVFALVIAVMHEDWMIAVVAVIVLSVGNAGLMLLAHLLKRMAVK